MTSPIYSSPLLYDLALRLKFRDHYRARLESVANEIADECRVVDLCCGDCMIYRRHLRSKRVSYRGFEWNMEMARRMRNMDVDVTRADVRTLDVPECDVALCLSSLYQFSDAAERVIRGMQRSSRTVLLLESVENLAASATGWKAALGAWITDYGEGPVTFRYGREAIERLWISLGFQRIEPLGPELLGVWERP